jgi:hypothetical protein
VAGPKGDTGAKGDAGPAGPAGPAGGGAANVTRIVGDPVPNGSSDDEWLAKAVAVCPDGERTVSGGFFQNVASLGEVYYNAPDDDDTAWIVLGANWADPADPDTTEGELSSIAYCAPSPAASTVPFAQRRAAALAEAAKVAKTLHKRR